MLTTPPPPNRLDDLNEVSPDGCETYRVDAPPDEHCLYVVSDLHLRRFDVIPNAETDGRHTLPENHQRRTLSLLDTIVANRSDDTRRHLPAYLVLLGDVFDSWAQPIHEPPVPLSEIIGNHPWLTQKLQWMMRLEGGSFTIIYVRGNHDLELESWMFITTSGSAHPVTGLDGIYFGGDRLIIGDVVLEHGHRHDISNTPRFGHFGLGNKQFPLGYFLTRMATSKGVFHHPIPAAVKALAKISGTVPAFDRFVGIFHSAVATARPSGDDSVIMMSEGVESRLISQLRSEFEKDMFRNPSDQLRENTVYFPLFSRERDVLSLKFELRDGILASMGVMDSFVRRYFPYFRVVVFGHSHEPKIWPAETGQKCYYINTGASYSHTRTPNFALIDTSRRTIDLFELTALGESLNRVGGQVEYAQKDFGPIYHGKSEDGDSRSYELKKTGPADEGNSNCFLSTEKDEISRNFESRIGEIASVHCNCISLRNPGMRPDIETLLRCTKDADVIDVRGEVAEDPEAIQRMEEEYQADRTVVVGDLIQRLADSDPSVDPEQLKQVLDSLLFGQE